MVKQQQQQREVNPSDSQRPVSGVRSIETHSAVEVGVRVRPVNTSELRTLTSRQLGMCVDMNTKRRIVTVDTDANHFDFNFEAVFWSADQSKVFSGQATVYEHFGQRLLDSFVDGFNCTFIAYGQTGSGKTYSLLGSQEDPGIIPRFCRSLTDNLSQNQSEWMLQISFYEIYNEKLRDLLVLNDNSVQLKVREHPETGPYVERLSCLPIRTFEDIMSWLDIGRKKRVTATTAVNEYSSRSHAIFVMKLSQKNEEDVDGETREYIRTSVINFVDLAGSERANLSTRMKETQMINKSLSCLSKVILQLSEKQSYVSYRDSVLTWLLKESLGGNAKTFMLATVSPLKAHVEETLSTLRYASHARTIINRVRVNEDPAYSFIKKLKEEIARLRLLLEGEERKGDAALPTDSTGQQTIQEPDVQSPNSEMVTLIRRISSLRDSYEKKSRRSGIVQPCMVEGGHEPLLLLLSPDMQLSPKLYFQLRLGRNCIGTSPECEIVLCGESIKSVHCSIERLDNNCLLLVPEDGAAVCVNGNDVKVPILLEVGDHIAIGRDQYLQYSSGTKDDARVDYKAEFDKAKYEMLVAENERLKLQLDALEKSAVDADEEWHGKLTKQFETLLQNGLDRYREMYNRIDEELEEKNHVLQEINGLHDDLLQRLDALFQKHERAFDRLTQSFQQMLAALPEANPIDYVRELNEYIKIFRVPFQDEKSKFIAELERLFISSTSNMTNGPDQVVVTSGSIFGSCARKQASTVGEKKRLKVLH